VIQTILVNYYELGDSLSRNKNKAAKWHLELLRIIQEKEVFVALTLEEDALWRTTETDRREADAILLLGDNFVITEYHYKTRNADHDITYSKPYLQQENFVKEKEVFVALTLEEDALWRTTETDRREADAILLLNDMSCSPAISRHA
jgi:DNA-binding PucR family transcriptional regulator